MHVFNSDERKNNTDLRPHDQEIGVATKEDDRVEDGGTAVMGCCNASSVLELGKEVCNWRS
ncbi:hypothetical protein BV53_01930 [Candidatus Synechococcus spongiarum LMB bulk15N]|uniref:Uncharacterized protein n=1 Tax=Candidatus Synechococcus spongiarum LMB bulk15N TaxID=1943583 RepID=A0A1T1D5I7_9SYNE|nr:hypothetical protein BV53_01930 [Candidatus Synechococcus spongiarum LMB bulk15N]